MDAPIVFVSHFGIREGGYDELARLTEEVGTALDSDKPRTMAYLAYADRDRTTMSFVHLFGDREAMDLHFEGAMDRARRAYEYLEPRGWEIYGSPSEAALETMRSSAASAGVTLVIESDLVMGFLHPA